MQCAWEHTFHTFDHSIDDEKARYTYSYIQTLYPQPLPCNSMHYLLQMLRRQSQVDRMLSVTASYVHVKIYMMPSCPRFDDFGPYKLKLIRRLHLAAWTLYHFLEKYREMLIFEHPNHSRPPHPSEAPVGSNPERPSACRSCAKFVRSLLPLYPGTEIIPAYHLYELCRQHLRSSSRAPTYAGSIERKLRGWSRKPPTEADLATFVVLGGIPELCKLSMLKGTYNQRIDVIWSFVDKVHGEVEHKRTTGSGSMTAFSSPALPSSAAPNNMLSPASFAVLTNHFTAPLEHISQDTLAAVPDLDHFVTDSYEWVKRLFELVRPRDQIVSAFGFIQNVLAGKGDRQRPGDGREGESSSLEGDEYALAELDYLAPVKCFN